MSDWVFAVFVNPELQGRHVDVLDLLVLVGHMMQFDGIRASVWVEAGRRFPTCRGTASDLLSS